MARRVLFALRANPLGGEISCGLPKLNLGPIAPSVASR